MSSMCSNVPIGGNGIVRTYTDCYKDYCDFIVKQTGDISYSYKYLIANGDEQSVHSFLYKSILELCYDPQDGLYYFCKFIIGNLLDIGYPSPLQYTSLFRKWDKLVHSNKKLAILCGRGHGKSLFFTQLLNIYDMFLFTYKKIIIISASQDQANHLLEEIKTIIDNNEWLATKKNANKWASTTIGYNEGYILVAGIGSEILGQHVDRILIDDILRNDNKLTDDQIEDYIDMTLDPMLLNRKGQMILVGTPKGEKDIFARIFHRKKENPMCPWEIYRYPAIIDYETHKIQCPSRFTWEELMNKRLSMGPLKFAREYQLEFFSRDSSLFPNRIVEPAKEKGSELILLNMADKRPPNWTFVMGVDCARSGSVSADYTVAIVLAYNTVTQAKQIVYMWREKGMKISDQAREIATISNKFNNCMVAVETNNMGQDVVDELVDNYNIYVEPITVGGRGTKEELIRFLITAFETEQIIIPRGDDWSRHQMDILESELTKYCVTKTPAGNERFAGAGSHDDTVSSLALANKATQIIGVPFAIATFGEGSATHSYDSLVNSFDSSESDLMKKIAMGIIK